MTDTAAPTRIRDRYKQMTHQSILDAFGLLIESSGVAGVSLAEVARVAGVSDTTIYNHFKNKDDLLDAFTRSRLSMTSMGEALASRPTKESPIAALRAYMRSQLPDFVDVVPTWHALMTATRRDDALWGAFLRYQQRSTDELAAQFLERRPGWSRVTARTAAQAVVGAMLVAIEEFPVGGTYGEFHEVLDEQLARLEKAWKD